MYICIYGKVFEDVRKGLILTFNAGDLTFTYHQNDWHSLLLYYFNTALCGLLRFLILSLRLV
jgi:hypothetical protein